MYGQTPNTKKWMAGQAVTFKNTPLDITDDDYTVPSFVDYICHVSGFFYIFVPKPNLK